MTTKRADVGFIPQVWNDHVGAHFERKMGLGQLALVDKTLESAPGETVKFPFYNKMSAASELTEDVGMEVDKLTDSSFSVTIKEVGKAVGWTDTAKRISAQKDPEGEAQRQMGILFAEKVDADIITEITTAGKFSAGVTAADYATGKLTANQLLAHLVGGFGDRWNECVAHAMHSLHFLELMNNAPTGFLTSSENDPFNGAPGFQGRILGRALFVLDTLPRGEDINAKRCYPVLSFKANPFGLYMANDFHPEKDRDILARENIVAGTMWYGVLSLNAKIAAADKRIILSNLPTNVAA